MTSMINALSSYHVDYYLGDIDLLVFTCTNGFTYRNIFVTWYSLKYLKCYDIDTE